MFRRSAAVLSCAFVLCLPAVPQSQPAPQQSSLAKGQQPEQPNARISVSVNEVILPVTVTDEKGKFISNLEAKDFRVLDEGKPQRIRFFSHDQKQPIVVGFLVDLSNASKIHWKTYQDAIMELV